MIANERPQDAFAGEETGTTEGMGGRRGLVDPPCGTLNPSSRSLTLGVNCDGKRDVPFRGVQLIADPDFRDALAPRVLPSTLVAAGRRAAYVTDGWLDGSVHFTAGIALCHVADCIVTDLAGESVHTGRGLIAAGDAETPAARLIKLVEPHQAAL